MKNWLFPAAFILVVIPSLALAQEKCLTQEQMNKILAAIDELDDIHKSKASVEFLNDIVIVRDWDGRMYVNGGGTVPLRLKLKIGKHVDRDVDVVLKPVVWQRPEPPSPMFRLRIRAQAGILLPDLIDSPKSGKFYDGGVSFDFFHLGILNAAIYTGVRSAGAGPGLDLTKNFGVYSGYSIMYDGFRSGAMVGTYFSFN